MTAERRPGPRRRPDSGGYARGDEKRLKIIEAALRRFGEDGYERASTRQIAQDAGVNPPALQYYFGGKEGLHLACAEYLAEAFSSQMQDAYQRAGDVDLHDPQATLGALCDIMDALADSLFETIETDGWSRFIARGQGEEGESAAYRLLRKTAGDELHQHCSRLIAAVVGLPASDPRTILCTITLLGQLVVFHLTRKSALERLGWPDLRGPRLQMLKDMLRMQTLAALRAYLASGKMEKGRSETG